MLIIIIGKSILIKTHEITISQIWIRLFLPQILLGKFRDSIWNLQTLLISHNVTTEVKVTARRYFITDVFMYGFLGF